MNDVVRVVINVCLYEKKMSCVDFVCVIGVSFIFIICVLNGLEGGGIVFLFWVVMFDVLGLMFIVVFVEYIGIV